MSLPSTYTKLDYIESHWTEYFDTGFVPNGNSRVTVDFEGAAVPSVVALFGARTGMTENVFAMWLEGNQALPQYGNVVYDTKPITTTNTVRHTYDLNKGVATVDGSSVSFTNLTFSAGQTLTLLALNSNGTVDGRRPSGKLYGAKVYNNNTLVRDFIPAMNASGTIGLWDDVNSTFYTNAGTGTLTTGKKHKTLIGGTGYEVKGGRVLIGGTGYSIKKGRTLIGGTGYDISFCTSIGELEEGTLVKLSELGSPVEFYIAKHDYESGLNGAGRTLLVRKPFESAEYWDSNTYYETRYAVCTLDSWFNGEYKERFAPFVQTAMGTTKFYYTISGSDKTVTTLERSIFTPSAYEMFGVTSTSSQDDNECNVEGSVLPIASTLRETLEYNERIWTRSVWIAYGGAMIICIGNNSMIATNAQSSRRERCPCFTLPASMKIDDDFNIIQS